jgi:hypothetical protein
MSRLVEAVAAAVNPRTMLADPVSSERIVGALAMSNTMGAVLVRMKYGGDRSKETFARCEALIHHHWARHARLGQRFAKAGGTDDLAHKIVRQALHEFVFDVCDHCKGRRALGGEWYKKDRKPTRICPVCKGSGRKCYTSSMRAVALKVPVAAVAKQWDGMVVLVLSWLENAETSCKQDLRRELSSANIRGNEGALTAAEPSPRI